MRRLAGLIATALAISAAPVVAQEPAWIYSVRPGDTIWALAQTHLRNPGNWPRLQALNDVADPRRLQPGSRLRLPVAWLRIDPANAFSREVTGEVSLRRAGASAGGPLARDDTLHEGDEVSTGPDGAAILELADGSRVVLGPDSRLALERLAAFGVTGMIDSRLFLERGRATTAARPAAGPASRFDIRTVPSISSVRGTEFRVGVEGGGERSATEVVGGRVAVQGASVTRLVGAGSGTVTRAGRPPERPRPLLPAARAADVPVLFDRVPLRLQAPPIEGAVEWRLALRHADADGAPLFERRQPGPDLRGPDLPDGRYRLMLRAIDAAGLEGLDREVAVEIDARPEPPALLQPAREGRVREATPTFAWGAVEGLRGYRLQVGGDPSFLDPLVDRTDLPTAELTSPVALPPGAWLWRVASIDATGQGPFSDPSPFERRDPPPSPEAGPPEIDADRLVIRVRDLGPGVRYRFQLARDREFRQLVADRVVDTPELIIDRPLPGRYFLRMGALDDDGYEGPYGPPQRIEVPATSWWPLVIAPLIALLLAL